MRVPTLITPTSSLPRRAPFLASALASALLCAGTAHAAGETTLPATQIGAQASSGDDSYTAASASTASKSDVPLKEEAQTVNVVPHQTLADYSVKSLDDVTRFISGASQGNTLGNTKDSVVKRGFGTNDDGSILRDGVKSILSTNFDATTDHVEVLKGPASLLYGAMDPGGLINVVSKQPQYVQSTTLSGSAYSEGGGDLGLDTTGPIGDTGLAYRLVAERKSEDYWRNYGVEQHTLVAPSLSWTGDRASLNLAYEYNDYTSPFDRGTMFVNGHPADVSYKKRLDEKWAKTVGIAQSVTARFEYQLSDDWKTRVTYGWNEDRYSLAIANPTALSASGVVTRQANGGHYDYETRYASWDFIGTQQLFGQEHDVLVGVDQEAEDRYRGKTYRNTAQSGFDIYSPSYGSLAEPSVVNKSTSDLTNQLNSTSLYVKDNWHLNDRWILVFGGRYQHYDQYIAQGMGSARAVSLDSNGDAAVPMLGLVYKASDALSLYGNYSRSFVPNTTVDDSGKTFDPEEGRSYEVGAKYDIAPGLNLNLAVYDIVKKNVVTTSTVDGESVSEAAGKVGSRGVELDVTGRIAERWDMVGTYAYDHTEILDDPTDQGNRLSQAPAHTASLYLTHHLRVPSQYGDWHAGAGAHYVGERAGDNGNSYYLPSYTVADAFLRWDVPVAGYKTHLQLNVDNLFNKEYYPSSTGSGQLQVNVGEPRSARLSASVNF
ncbi:TonB-dependent siderophore receptor [Pseudomonas sp. M47T1]|uniref:TonB-dependent siderophore receptor n=2 Tax=unclassified Pseudomonas TaxID=196821 RepID=UPI0002608674|nr:TonB-dependent siderophore receptor [Pseudomonas sp. M47T1]